MKIIHNYTMKVTDAKQKKIGIEKLTCSYQFSSVSQLRHSITETVTDNFDEIGYIEPGHGMKGKNYGLLEMMT